MNKKMNSNNAPMPKRKALIVGATGVVGRNLLKHLIASGDWEIAAVSRRKPDVEQMFFRMWDEMRADRIILPAQAV